jgi:hypothetical protein
MKHILLPLPEIISIELNQNENKFANLQILLAAHKIHSPEVSG